MKIIPVIFIVVGVMLCIDGIANMGKGVEVTATIADIRTESGTPGDSDSDDHKVYLNYTYEGEEYKDVYYRVYSDFMYVGKKIKIKIDENDPTKIYYSSDNITMGLFFIVLPLFYYFQHILIGKIEITVARISKNIVKRIQNY